jgi:hypothetical protein
LFQKESYAQLCDYLGIPYQEPAWNERINTSATNTLIPDDILLELGTWQRPAYEAACQALPSKNFCRTMANSITLVHLRKQILALLSCCSTGPWTAAITAATCWWTVKRLPAKADAAKPILAVSSGYTVLAPCHAPKGVHRPLWVRRRLRRHEPLQGCPHDEPTQRGNQPPAPPELSRGILLNLHPAQREKAAKNNERLASFPRPVLVLEAPKTELTRYDLMPECTPRQHTLGLVAYQFES